MKSCTPEKDETRDGGSRAGFGMDQTEEWKGTEVDANKDQPGAQLAADLLQEIAMIATRADTMVRMTGVNDLDEAEAFIGMLRDSITRIGWIADMGLNQLNAGEIGGDAKWWMLPPVAAARVRMAEAH